MLTAGDATLWRFFMAFYTDVHVIYKLISYIRLKMLHINSERVMIKNVNSIDSRENTV